MELRQLTINQLTEIKTHLNLTEKNVIERAVNELYNHYTNTGQLHRFAIHQYDQDESEWKTICYHNAFPTAEREAEREVEDSGEKTRIYDRLTGRVLLRYNYQEEEFGDGGEEIPF